MTNAVVINDGLVLYLELHSVLLVEDISKIGCFCSLEIATDFGDDR